MAHAIGARAQTDRVSGARTAGVFLAALFGAAGVLGFGLYVVATWGFLAFIAAQAATAVLAVLVKDVVLPALRRR